MIIIDKEKDFYDYLATVNGVDNNIVYSRYSERNKASKKDSFYDIIFPNNSYFQICPLKDTYDNKYICFFLLEIGYSQFLFRIEFNSINDVIIDRNVNLIKVFNENKRCSSLYNSPINIWFCNGFIKFKFYRHHFIIDKNYEKNMLLLNLSQTLLYTDKSPIYQSILLKNSIFISFLDASQVWNEIYNFLISQKEPIITDSRTNHDKILSHGFDDKISFRKIK